MKTGKAILCLQSTEPSLTAVLTAGLFYMGGHVMMRQGQREEDADEDRLSALCRYPY